MCFSLLHRFSLSVSQSLHRVHDETPGNPYFSNLFIPSRSPPVFLRVVIPRHVSQYTQQFVQIFTGIVVILSSYVSYSIRTLHAFLATHLICPRLNMEKKRILQASPSKQYRYSTCQLLLGFFSCRDLASLCNILCECL